MGLVTLTVLGVVIVISAAVAAVVKEYQARKQAVEIIEQLRKSLGQYCHTYTLEECDNALIEKCRDCILKEFPNGITQKFAKLDTMDARKQLTEDLVANLASCMELDGVEVEFPPMPADEYGCMKPLDGGIRKVCLNEALLVADPEQIVKTICHELRHAVQLQSFTDNKWGYSNVRVAQWLYSWNNYISCTSVTNFEAYYNQIIEVDARHFVDELFKDINLEK